MTDRNRLISIVKNSLIRHIDKTCKLAENITDDLLANGVIVPPCKVGDTIYEVGTDGKMYQSKITSVLFDTSGIAFDYRAIGHTVFLTKEEAEKKLKELKNNG